MKKTLHFNVNAYTARLIGRENVSNLDGAILELVKNTYDADASKCVLYYERCNDTLYIMDNGTGMTEDIIEKHWMTIGNSSKHTNFMSKTGRIQTGAKGIGRFALDRVGDNCVMYTKNNVDNYIIQWKVNWRDFERNQNLTDITAEIEYIQDNFLYDVIDIKNQYVKSILNKFFYNTGTIFKVSDFREEWNNDLISGIRKSLGSLIPPDIENEFSIYLFNDNQNDTEALIASQNIDLYDYKIQFYASENGNVQIQIDRNEFDFKDEFDYIMKEAGFTNDDKEYFLGKKKIIINTTISKLLKRDLAGLGKFDGTLYFNKKSATKNDTEKFYYKDITGRKDYSDVFGGIKVYRDNFRVRPYGEKNTSGYDWLLLGNRRAKSPAAISHESGSWRVSTEQISGIVNISRMNVNLPDQSNREGIVETIQFKSLKEVIIEIISTFEEDRQYVGRKLAVLYDKRHDIENVEQKIRNKAEKSEKKKKNSQEKSEHKEDNFHDDYDNVSAEDARRVFDKKDETIRNLEDENRMLRNLATTGIVCNQYIHETKESVNDIGITIATAIDVLEDEDIQQATRYLEEAQGYVKTLNSWFSVTIGSIRRDKRSMSYVDVSKLISEQVSLWRKALSRQGIDIKFSADDEIMPIRCFPYEIESIISNLIANSVEAFKRVDKKQINIFLKNVSDGIEIEYKDTGRGLAEGYKTNPDKILDAFETDRRNTLNEKIGTGLGMWIIKNIVNDYDGVIDLTENKKKKDGFCIGIKLKVLKKEV